MTNLEELHTRLKFSIDFEKMIPEVGAAEVSYTKLLEMLSRKQVKRLLLLGEGKIAVLEKVQGPLANDSANHSAVVADQRDLLSQYIIDERPEHELSDQKFRFFCEFPGDAWDDGELANLIKETFPDKDSYGNTIITQLPKRITFDRFGNPTINTGRIKTFLFDQTSCELVVIEPHNVNAFLADNKDTFLAVLCLAGFRLFLMVVDGLMKRIGLKDKDRFSVQTQRITAPSAREFNVTSPENNKKNSKLDTGVRFADVAGVDRLIRDVRDVLSMMKGEPKWKEMGVRMPRGILLSGPPGTGKTLLAKAIAGEAGIPFYSANGAQFMEKFQGVCAARVRELFAQARTGKNHGAIIFIDEIDALGLARKTGSGDVGSTEREQGLLQLLVEMDGFKANENVLVLGATNRVEALDKALIRPGRFDRIIHLGNPTKINRIAVLKVHAKGKKFLEPKKTEELLGEVSEITTGYSGAELASILNEAAILSVRDGKLGIDLAVILEAIDKCKLGLPKRLLPENQGKRRFAITQTAKALLMTLSPNIPKIERLILRPRGGFISRILIRPSASMYQSTMIINIQDNGWKKLRENSPFSDNEIFQKFLASFYAPRAVEENLYGPGGITLATSNEITLGVEAAHHFTEKFLQHCSARESPEQFDSLNVKTIGLAFVEAKSQVIQKIEAISAVTSTVLHDNSEMLNGSILLVSLDVIKMSDVNPEIADQMIRKREEKITLRKSVCMTKNAYLDPSNHTKIHSRNSLFANMEQRHQMGHYFKNQENAPFPTHPDVPLYHGFPLNEWMETVDTSDI